MTPLFPWPGGKTRLLPHLLPLITATPHTCYVEAFAGGAAVLFAREPAKVEVLNDVNGELVRLYRVVSHHLDEFVRQFRWALTSREMFRWAKLQHVDTHRLFDRFEGRTVPIRYTVGAGAPVAQQERVYQTLP